MTCYLRGCKWEVEVDPYMSRCTTGSHNKCKSGKVPYEIVRNPQRRNGEVIVEYRIGMPSKIYMYDGLGLQALLVKGPKALLSHGKVGNGLDIGFKCQNAL